MLSNAFSTNGFRKLRKGFVSVCRLFVTLVGGFTPVCKAGEEIVRGFASVATTSRRTRSRRFAPKLRRLDRLKPFCTFLLQRLRLIIEWRTLSNAASFGRWRRFHRELARSRRSRVSGANQRGTVRRRPKRPWRRRWLSLKRTLSFETRTRKNGWFCCSLAPSSNASNKTSKTIGTYAAISPDSNSESPRFDGEKCVLSCNRVFFLCFSFLFHGLKQAR